MKRVLIIGGYGNFGSYIARALATDANILLLIGGRSQAKADAFAASLKALNPAFGCTIDIDGNLEGRLREIDPDIVIHTTGPFQTQDYRVARAAIAVGAHYFDLADARRFVASIGELDAIAKQAGVAVIAGASSVPCLTAAFLDRYKPRFAKLTSATYGIAAAQATNRGLGTAAAILSYVGKPFTILSGGGRKRAFGWQGIHAVRYPELGLRLFGYCDIPDLELFPERYPDLHDLAFVAGHEVKVLHIGTWLFSWLVRLGLVRSLSTHAETLLKLSFLFDPFGSDKSGLHMFLRGVGHNGKPAEIRIFMVARQVHGPNIPCFPAIILTRRMAAGEQLEPGARPCLDLVGLEELLGAMEHLDITTSALGAGVDERWPRRRVTDATIRRAQPLFVFDGHCVLCSTGAAFIMKHDRKGAVQFASAQSELGSAIYEAVGMPMDQSYLLIDLAGFHTKSDGYFRLAGILGGWWRLALIGKLVPRSLRDWIYDRVASNRYRWFGRTNHCKLLAAEQRSRLVTDDPGLWAQLKGQRRP